MLAIKILQNHMSISERQYNDVGTQRMREGILLASLISVCLCSLVCIFDHMQFGRYVITTSDVKANMTIITESQHQEC